MAPLPLTDEQLISRYQDWLGATAPNNVPAYADRLLSDRAAALFEAVVHWLLTMGLGLHVVVLEDSGHGGVDFGCSRESGGTIEAVVEATNLRKEDLAERSGIPLSASEWAGQVKSIGMKLRSTAQKKAHQVSGHDVPRFVFIGTDHEWAYPFLIDRESAAGLITGDLHVRFTLDGGGGGRAELATHLQESLFFCTDSSGNLKSVRRSISAVVLVAWARAQCWVIGALHPDPAVKADPGLLAGVPFARLKRWPPDGGLEVEWMVGDPRPWHAEIMGKLF